MRCLLCLILSWFFFSAFFWSDDEEKQLRTLHQSAEAAIKKEEFGDAKESYGELIERIGVNTSQKYSVDWPTYVDIVVRYAEACERLEEMEDGEKALSNLLQRRPPEEHIPRIKLMRARFRANQKTPGEAFLEMQQVSSCLVSEGLRTEDLSFFHALEYSLNSQYDQLVRKAKRYLVTGYYTEAIGLYEEILEAIEAGYYPKAATEHSLIEKKLRYRLAESYYNQANFEQTLSLCYNQHVVEDRIDREMIYLSALCYREKKQYERALDLFQNYTHSADRMDLDHYDHALFEIGLFYYQAGNFKKARNYFERLQGFEGKPAHVAALYLARISFQEGMPEVIESLVAPISKKLPEDDPLQYECDYLRAEGAYACGEYTRACTLFEHSLPANPANSEWSGQALFHLGWCYIRLGEDLQKDEEERKALFCRGEKIFVQLIDTEEKEAAALALARIYLQRWKQFEDPGSLTLIDSMLMPFQTPEAFLLRAEAAQGYVGKEILLKQATDERFSEETAYADAWYERGMNHFQEGLKDPENGYLYFELAATAFTHSFRAHKQKGTPKAAHVLKLGAKADAYRNSPISSLALLEKLLSEFNESVEEHEETLYLRGLVASRLLDLSYFPVAEESLQLVAQGNGKYRDEALYVLGSLYFGQEAYAQARDAFYTLASLEPLSAYASEAWFWAAEAAEKIADPDHKRIRARVYWDYPDSEKAPEAFFRQYPYEEYLAGDSRALTHLHTFPTLFPHSPILVVVHYLRGLHEEGFEKSKEAFEEAIKAFPLCLSEGKIPDPALVYFRYRAMLELAQLYLRTFSSEPEVTTALNLLQSLINDFSTSDHPLTSLLMQKEPYPPLYEEAEYALVKAYVKCGKKRRAQERLSKMLVHYDEAGIREGYFLSHVWRQQGKLAHRCGDFETAVNCFEISEECGQDYLSGDKKLSLWLLQSHAYRGKKEYDTAMRLLSKVINSDIASPLRLKAMFHRAEVYELQGRPELAMRQLEAMSKKGGDWALLAQERLRDYGM